MSFNHSLLFGPELKSRYR